MKLKSVRVMNFRCVDDSGPFSISPVTCLVGKNGAGKTSLLEALYKLNPDVSGLGKFDVLLEYPRWRRKEYEQRAATQPDDALVASWELNDEEIALLEKTLGPGAIRSQCVTVRKGYYEGRRWEIDLDEQKIAEQLSQTASSDEAQKQLHGQASSAKDLTKATKEQEESPAANGKSTPGTEQTIARNPVREWVEKKLDELLPKFVYFSKWHVLNGRISIDDILKNKTKNKLSGSDRVFLALLELGGTTIEQIASLKSSEALIADLEAASNPITDQISRYWSQDRHLRVNFHVHPGRPEDPAPFNKGLVFETRILNTRQSLTLNFDERSTGFVWFFSFLVWFSQVRKNYGENLIILLDDPGLGLHAKAQWDLLRYISEKLEPNYQVLYTTHSPFMVDARKLDRVLTVEEVTKLQPDGNEQYLGTKVGDKTLSADAETLLPLQTALGYEIARTLLSEHDTLLVEQPSDVLYLRWFSQRLRERGRTGLDGRWTITPCGDLSKIGTFIGLFSQSGRRIAVLLNVPAGQSEQLTKWQDQGILRNCRVLPLSKYTQGNCATLEDVIGVEAYFGLVNRCYKLPRKRRIRAGDGPAGEAGVLGQVEQHFKTLGAEAGQFDRYAPAEHLASGGKKLARKLPGLEGAMERFEQLFADIDSCLNE